MELQIRAKDMELNRLVRDYVEKKVRRISRHIPAASMVMVELASENARLQDQRVVAQLTLEVNGVTLRGEERGQNAMVAMDAVVDVIDRRIAKYKGKTYRVEQTKRAIRRGQGPPEQLEEVVSQESPEEFDAPEAVVKSKSFPIKPMSVDEAIFQMEMLGHDFFFFLNSDEDIYNVLYRRHDGAYGLIQPEPL